MYIFKNAFKSITRTKARNILIGVIIVVIATSCCIALSIKNSATKLIESYEDSYNIEATLSTRALHVFPVGFQRCRV
jgi:putative ABC transport system permease protein